MRFLFHCFYITFIFLFFYFFIIFIFFINLFFLWDGVFNVEFYFTNMRVNFQCNYHQTYIKLCNDTYIRMHFNEIESFLYLRDQR